MSDLCKRAKFTKLDVVGGSDTMCQTCAHMPNRENMMELVGLTHCVGCVHTCQIEQKMMELVGLTQCVGSVQTCQNEQMGKAGPIALKGMLRKLGS